MKKKILGVMLAAGMCVSASMIAFANAESSVEAPGYGRLLGKVEAINNRGYYVETWTEVNENTDEAFLRTNIEMMAPDGSSMFEDSAESGRGVMRFNYKFSVNNFEGVSSVFCSHEVVGGSIYPAAVVYTATNELPQ